MVAGCVGDSRLGGWLAIAVTRVCGWPPKVGKRMNSPNLRSMLELNRLKSACSYVELLRRTPTPNCYRTSKSNPNLERRMSNSYLELLHGRQYHGSKLAVRTITASISLNRHLPAHRYEISFLQAA